MDRLESWTENPKTKYFSGRATYERTFDLPAGKPEKGAQLLLDFGAGSPTPIPDPHKTPNMKAYFNAPIRDSAEIYVDNQRAGVVWHPPYRLDITRFVRPGRNSLRIIVGNTAINELAGQSLPDYRLLWARYGMLFVPQGMDDLKPLPSGILGPVTLVESTTHRPLSQR